MSNDFLVEEILENKENKKRKNKQRKAVIFSSIAAFLIIVILFVSNVFADNVVDLWEDSNGEYLFFEIDHNITTAKYKYYGYGYTVSLQDKSTKEFLDLRCGGEAGKQVFMPNSMFSSTMEGSIEKVKVYTKDLYDMISVEDEYYYSDTITVHLNARMGIRVDGVLTHLYDSLEGDIVDGMPDGHNTGDYNTAEHGSAPLNDGNGLGIRNAIIHYYGVSWGSATQNNLDLNFNIKHDLKPPARYDGLFVEYKQNGKTIDFIPIKQFQEAGTVPIEIKDIPGYKYNGTYEKGIFYDRNMVSGKGDAVSVEIKKSSKSYTPKCHHIILNYDIDDGSSEGGNIPTGEYSKYKIKYVDKASKKEIYVATDYMSPNKITSVTIDAKAIRGYKYSSWEWSFSNESGLILDSKKGTGNLSINIRKETHKYDITLYYEKSNEPEEPEEPEKPKPKCEPKVDGDDASYSQTMKQSKFNSLSSIPVGVNLGVHGFKYGKDESGNNVDGTHRFSHFDYYVYPSGKGKPSIGDWDNTSTSVKFMFNIPKSMFSQSTTQENLWTANIPVDYVAFCKCGGAAFAMDHNINVKIITVENKPPVAMWWTYTEVEQADGNIRKIFKTFVDIPGKIENLATDPNGEEDIIELKREFKCEGKLEAVDEFDVINGIYYQRKAETYSKDIEIVKNDEYGNTYVTFKTVKTREVTDKVTDEDLLTDTYTNTITPVVLDLKPTAVLTDILVYSYPSGVVFGGKQNRVIGLSSEDSFVADFLKGTGVTINHSKDCVEIIPLNNQSLSSIYFENDIKKEISNNKIKINNVDFISQKLMFKEEGQYKIRLKVTDTKGNTSDWTEQTITIVEDKLPTVKADINFKNYRNDSGIATVALKNILVGSTDKDYAVIEKIQYRYDSNNDGIFTNEKLIDLSLNSNQVSFTSKELGKYQFVVKVKETFGQPTLEKYINDSDYKRAEITFTTEIDNIAPDVIKFEIKRKNEE